MSDNSPLLNLDQIDPTPVRSLSLSPGRNQDLPSLPTPTMPIGPLPMLSAPAPEVLAPLQSPQISLRGIANKDHIAAMPTIAPVGPTPRNMSLTPEADATVSAGPTLDPDLRLVIHR
jgi:hypothetical protein